MDSFGSTRAFGNPAARRSASSFSRGEPHGSRIVSGASAWPSAIQCGAGHFLASRAVPWKNTA
jgi:hypothetical protein